MDYLQKIQFAANSYYNRGLEMAKERDLSGAALYLKRALQFNKYHTDARNLLGLIFYEMGETSDALTQWVISINLQPEKNLADHYLDEVQRKPGQLEIASQTIKKYNQALFHAQGGSDDLAVLQLKRIVEEKPNFVKAHLLLALLYMEHGDYTKAGKSLFKVLQIDKTNQKAQRYMEYVKSRTGKADVEKRKMKNAFSHREMQDDDVILPPTYKENTGWQSIINIAIGLVLGAVLVVFMVMPARERSLNYEHNQEMRAYADKLNLANQKADSLQEEADQYRQEKEAAEENLNSLMGDSDSTLSQYGTMVQIVNAWRKGDIQTAVGLYIGLDQSKITDESMAGVLGELQAEMNASAPAVLESLGAQSTAAGDYDTALHYYEKYMEINDKNPQIIFNMAMIYKTKGDEETADQLFGQVIMNFADSPLAETARAERGY
ncbi:MAG: tetratricopeptide repeat protein [Sakamotonia sp.]|jgi:tetratricopeptide (TPR) repeat protein